MDILHHTVDQSVLIRYRCPNKVFRSDPRHSTNLLPQHATELIDQWATSNISIKRERFRWLPNDASSTQIKSWATPLQCPSQAALRTTLRIVKTQDGFVSSDCEDYLFVTSSRLLAVLEPQSSIPLEGGYFAATKRLHVAFATGSHKCFGRRRLVS